MEAVKQSEQHGIGVAVSVQGAGISGRRKIILAVAIATAFYIVWGIYRIVS